MNKNVPNSRTLFQGAQILGLPSVGPKIYTQLHKRIHIPWATRTVNPLLSPPAPLPLSNKPYFIRGRRLMSPNSPSPSLIILH